MARTVLDAITRARQAIADTGAVRADDATCRGYVVDAVNLIRGARPDLFLGAYGTSYTSFVNADTLPVPDQYFLPVAMFVGAMVESQDEETSDHARGTLLTQIAVGALK